MKEMGTAFQRVPNVLSGDDIASLRQACKRHLSQEESIPSYTLIDSLDIPAYTKIKRTLEDLTGTTLYYLNDFYIYTDDTFGAGWHVDTELFTFEHALNAWVLLSPDQVTDPLCFIDHVNDTPDGYFHSVKIDGDQCTFSNFSTRERITRSLTVIDQEKLHTPSIDLGDILVLNPRRFHKTNTTEAKHCLAIKFVFEGSNGFLSSTQVSSRFWPEVGVFNKLVKAARDWDSVIEGIRGELKTPEGRKALSAGFYPGKIELYKRMVQTL